MIRLTHLSGSLQGTVSNSPKAVVRIGRGSDNDIVFNPTMDTKVSTHHAEIRFDGAHYTLIDTNSSNGTLVNGKRVDPGKPHKLKAGDHIHFGAGGPEAKFELETGMPSGFSGGGGGGYGAPPPSPYGSPPPSPYGSPPMAAARKPPPNTEKSKSADQLAQEAQRKIAEARAMSGGANSGQTMFIMADTVKRVEDVTEKKSGRKWIKVVLAVVVAAGVVMAGLGVVIWQQNQQLEAIVNKKKNADVQIQKIQLQMQLESDPEKLVQLEEQLTLLTGKAQQAIGELEQKNKDKAAEVTNQGDDLDREIRRILRKFDADTYAIPPIFKQRLQYHIDATAKRSNTKTVVWKRKKQFWPIIMREFAAYGLPEEIAYVAWTESQFDPFAESQVGARGMWQFMPSTAREYGLRVADNWKQGGYDERTDVQKLTKAAARYLAFLLADFGSDAFMLAIASYNKGEGGMRRVLRQVALEPGGWRKEKRDFWHLYRMKKLPEETLEYVPQILAAAIIGNNPGKYGLDP